MRMCTRGTLISVAGWFVTIASPANAGYLVFDIGSGVDAHGISLANELTGGGPTVSSGVYMPGNRPFDASLDDLGLLGGVDSTGARINDGKATGAANIHHDIYHAFYRDPSGIVDLGTFGGGSSERSAGVDI